MKRAAKPVLFVLGCLLVDACSGGSSCGGCVEPIPGGYPLDRRVTNGVQARLTPNAITFMEANYSTLLETLLPDGLEFPIDETVTTVDLIGDVTICPGGGCSARVNVTGFDLQPTPPASLVLVAHVEVITSNIPISMGLGLLCICWDTCDCNVDLDTRREPPPYNTIRMTATFTVDTRTGYTSLDVTGAELVDDIQNGDIDISNANLCGAIVCNLANMDFMKSFIVGMLQDQLTSTLEDQMATFTCMQCPDSGCPTGSTCNGDGYCEFPDGECVSILLGLEGQTDLGSSMAAFSPGLTAPIMFVDAAGGYAAVDDGVNLGLYGGLEAVERNSCVPATYDAPWLSYGPVPRATEFSSGSTVVSCRRCPTGIECSTGYACSDTGQCMDAAGTSCEQVTQQVMLKTGISETYLNRVGAGMFESGALCLSVSTRSVPELGSGLMNLLFPAIKTLTWDRPSPMAIEIKPQLPPRFDVGDDPLLTVHLDQAQMEFYLWMHERYVRILTVQMDITAPLDLRVEEGAIVPSLGMLAAANITVTDAAIIGPPNNVEGVLEDLMELVATMIPPFSPIALPAFSGFLLEVPEGGITHVAEGGEDFLALYANLAIAPLEPPPPSPVETRARLSRIDRPAPDAPDDRIRDLVPTAVIDLDADLARPTKLAVEYRYRIDGRDWSPWSRTRRVEVRDAALLFAGNHYVSAQARLADDPGSVDPTPAVVVLPAADLPGVVPAPRAFDPARGTPDRGLRGRPTDTGSSGCSCTVAAGSTAAGPLGSLAALLAGLLLVGRRRFGAAARRLRSAVPFAALAAFAALGTAWGCDCGTAVTPPDADAEDDGEEIPPLDPLMVGFVGQHSEVAVGPTGTIWVSGYSAGASPRSWYGDLVVGTWDGASREMDWAIVDGVPSGAPIAGDPAGWRGGIAEPGDDVGMYSTIVISRSGEPIVAYFDATNGALKLATHGEMGWRVAPDPIDDAGEAGRYADMAIGPDGRLAISYNSIEEKTDAPGTFASKAKVARANDSTNTTWTISELESVDIPCWKDLCGEDRICLASTRACAVPEEESLCGADGCEVGFECIAGVCEEVFDAPPDFPEGVAIVTGIAIMPSGEPIAVYYDRTHGDLRQALSVSGTWTVTTLDGADVPPENALDAGWYPSIAVDAAGQRHVAYVDGINENLVYLNPDAGLREVVDGRSAADHSRSIVGDDTTIRVSASGTVWISYQDATAGSLMLARRTGPDAWDVRVVDDEDTTGFYANMVLAGSSGETPFVSTYYHKTIASGTSTTRYAYESGVRVFEVTP